MATPAGDHFGSAASAVLRNDDAPTAAPHAAVYVPGRISAAGKFFTRGNAKIRLKGVTYGPFAPDADGCLYHTPNVVEADFAAMAALGLNSVRVYTAPPRWLLDIAEVNGLGVIAGIPWTQHVAFLDNPVLVADSYRQVDDAMRRCGNHPAMLAIAVGNEIPAPVVRWYGHRRVERHLHKLCNIVKAAGPDTLVTYANYPTTEYLELPFLDFVSFNVYLDETAPFDAYLARLQNIAGERPLVLTEIGVDSARFGEPKQAAMLAQKIDAVFGGGAAGMFVFSWTDEWFRHGHEIDQWKFGLVDRGRKPRISSDAVAAAFAAAVKPRDGVLPKVSVIVCSRNGAATIAETLRHAVDLDYPDFEVIVVDDGSTDDLSRIASQFPVRLITQPHLGLSAARNAGLQAATGDIVAYIDDDAYPDPDWLTYLVRRMQQGDVVGAGGPNLAVPGDGEVAECVAHAPGGPMHVLLTDTIAEHIPGCNMAFFRQALLKIGGFDPRFRIAGDDVDICWRLQEAGGALGFSHAAQVWHHRRNKVSKFWRQQVNYGRAEAELERKWPAKYTTAGHATWTGRLYGKGVSLFRSRRRVYHGVWGEALFQQTRHVTPGYFASLPMMPEWYVLLLLVSVMTALGTIWRPLLFAGPVLLAGVGFVWLQAFVHARRAILHGRRTMLQRLRIRLLIAFLYRLQPLARFTGRYLEGLTPWRLTGVRGCTLPVPTKARILVTDAKCPSEWLTLAERRLRAAGVPVMRGTGCDRWDLEVRGGIAAAVRIGLLTEDFADQTQLVRWRMMPRCPVPVLMAILIAASISLAAILQHHHVLSIVFGTAAVLGIAMTARGCGAAMATFRRLCVDGHR